MVRNLTKWGKVSELCKAELRRTHQLNLIMIIVIIIIIIAIIIITIITVISS